MQSTPAFDESKTSCAVVGNPMAEVIKIEQNVLEAAEKARESRTQEVFDGKPSHSSLPGNDRPAGPLDHRDGRRHVAGRHWPRRRRKRTRRPPSSTTTKKTEAAETKAATASDRDTIGFSQENVAAQMNELEERMFRLSEALRGLEPENASRLRLALKFSREEQILEQMRETHKLLKDAQLSKAETEAKELIAKLEHLRTLLLAEDLDFQLKLARLRQMRETLGQLERIVKEERRELGWSRFAMEQAQTPGAVHHPPARPGGARPRPAGRDRRHQEHVKERRRSRRRTPGRRSGSAR